MTPDEYKALQEHLRAAAAILFKHTPKEQLKDFAGIELAVGGHILDQVAPEIGIFFKQQQRNGSRTK
jgi:hypothetical protein